jgi:predicted nuclease with TOPRIM domain
VTVEIDNSVLEHLRAIRSDLGTIKGDVREVKQRLTSLDISVAGLRTESGHLYGDLAEQDGRYDRLAERIERIERRLELSGDV